MFYLVKIAPCPISFQKAQGNEGAFGANVGYGWGREYRKPISEKVSFIHGISPLVNVAYRNQSTEIWVLGGTLGYMLGFQLDFSDAFYVSIETIPALSGTYTFNQGENNDNYRLSAGFNSNAGVITLAYRFTTEN